MNTELRSDYIKFEILGYIIEELILGYLTTILN